MVLLFLMVLMIKGNSCDWASQWLAPLKYQYTDILTQNTKNSTLKLISEDDNSEYFPFNRLLQLSNEDTKNKSSKVANAESSILLKISIEKIVEKAETLSTALKKQIKAIENQEKLLKEAIANGRFGVTTLTVSTLGHAPRTYIIRNGFWTLCNGLVQYPSNQISYNTFPELFSAPRCLGQEVTSKRDQCVFNSIIKYETIPVSPQATYFEEDYICLKTSFNNTMERYMSVTKKVLDETCKNGVIKSISDSVLHCGVRILSEYRYYSHRDERTATLPMEYCTEKDGSCELIVAWHLSNKTIENFEFLQSDKNFRKFFIKSDSYMVPTI